MAEESKDFWVIFDGYGNQVFNTYALKFANFDMMDDSEYNKTNCVIVKNPIDDLGVPVIHSDGIDSLEYLPNGKVKRVKRDRTYVRPNRTANKHIPS